MYCQKCGTYNTEGNPTCVECDQPLVASPTGETPDAESQQTAPYDSVPRENNERKQSKAPVIIAISAILVAIAVGVGVYFAIRPTGNTSDTSQPLAVSGSKTGVVSIASNTEFAISFNGGGAETGSMAPLVCHDGEEVTIPKCGFSRSGSSFAAWEDDDGKKYMPGDTLAISKDVTLTATWDTETCTVKFLGAGANSGNADNMTTSYGSNIILPKCGYMRRGYDFDCWIDEYGNTFDPGDSVSINEDTTFVAQWKSQNQSQNADPQPMRESNIQSTNVAQTAITPNNLPRSWEGTYEGYTTHTEEGVIERSVTIVLSQVESGGSLEGTCYVGVDEKIAGATHGSYKVKGTIDWQSGQIHLYGTEWVDKGGLIGMGGFRGTVASDSWSIYGQWYDPDGEAQNGDWHMWAR